MERNTKNKMAMSLFILSLLDAILMVVYSVLFFRSFTIIGILMVFCSILVICSVHRKNKKEI